MDANDLSDPSGRLRCREVAFFIVSLQVRELSPAEAAKEDGNAAFKRGDLPAALAAYTLALERDPTMVVAANNRALVNIRMERFGDAESDSNMVGCNSLPSLSFSSADGKPCCC